jgi:hypothetical protein
MLGGSDVNFQYFDDKTRGIVGSHAEYVNEDPDDDDLPPKYRSRSYVRISQGRKEKKWAGSATQQNRSSACFGRLKSFRAKV